MMTMRFQRGMLMLEVMIALLLFAIGVLGTVKMQALASANSVNSEDRATAALLANDLIAEMWTNNSAAIPTDYASAWQPHVRDVLGASANGTLVVAGSQATVTIIWTPRGRTDGTQATYSTQVYIQ